MEARFVPIIKNDYSMTIDIPKIETLIDSNTVCIVGSAAGFPHAVLDDIPTIARIGSLLVFAFFFFAFYFMKNTQ